MRHRLFLRPSSIVLLTLSFLSCPVSSIWCYNSDTPHLNRGDMKECPDGDVCFVEFFINNISGTPIHRYERFCTQRAHCVRHNIQMNHDVEIFQLALASQDAFYTENANMTKAEGEQYIASTWFRCCDTDACNSIDLHSVKGRYNVWPSLNAAPGLTLFPFVILPLALTILQL